MGAYRPTRIGVARIPFWTRMMRKDLPVHGLTLLRWVTLISTRASSALSHLSSRISLSSSAGEPAFSMTRNKR
ncbi:hypothetical protein BDV11DRAFT_96128 [Aspergillus similis]